EALALNANSLPPSLSPDMLKMTTSYTIPLSGVSSAILRHTRPMQVARTLNPVSAAQYTGIIIIASESLPIYGMKSSVLAVPCLFPKIWDSEMNLIYERNMLESRNISMVHYSPLKGIFQRNPSGLSPELQAVVGDKPLKIFASGVFGIKPTDIIIDKNDAMLIISSEENRRLLSQGKVAIILDESALKLEFFSK
ncbi:MAG: polymerase, partial [Spirochaetes bacterium]|nr:polymerase [Spirochaetota bacterium]